MSHNNNPGSSSTSSPVLTPNTPNPFSPGYSPNFKTENEDLEFKIPKMEDSIFEDGNGETQQQQQQSPSASLTKQFEGGLAIRQGSGSSSSSFATSPSHSNYCK